jgi:hypothetical protein
LVLEEQRSRVFENRVLRRIFRPKRDEVTLHNEVLLVQYYCDVQIKEGEMGGPVARMGENTNAYKVLEENLKESITGNTKV